MGKRLQRNNGGCLRSMLPLVACWLVVSAVLFVLIYLVFSSEATFIPSGVNLSRTDWLSFSGAFLAFMGTTLIGVATFWNTNRLDELSENRRRRDRTDSIQPVFAISVEKGIQRRDSDYSIVRICITHIGKEPITHFFYSDKYMRSCLMPGDAFEFYLTNGERITEPLPNGAILLGGPYAGDRDDGLPSEILIQYDDCDGETWLQEFKIEEVNNKLFYGLSERFQ